jgi:hypothetical protein
MGETVRGEGTTMLKHAAAFCLLGMLLLIAACSPGAPAATTTRTPVPNTPTPAQTPTPAPTVTPVVRATLPPTWTPEATEATEAVLPSPTVDPRLAKLRFDPTAIASCGQFSADLSRTQTTVTLGSPVQLYWFPAKNTSVYEVTVYGPDSGVVGVQRTSDTTLTLRPSLFRGYNQPYAWVVIPYDANGNPICLPRGGDLRTAS